VLAAELRGRPLEPLVLAVEPRLPPPGPLEVVPHIEAQPPQPLRLELHHVAVLKSAEAAVIRPRRENVPGLEGVDRGHPLDAARDLVGHVAGVEALLELAVDPELDVEPVGIRDLVATLKALPPGHPLETLLREAPDFRQEAALADALLHPQDRAYSVPQLFDFIAKAGLTFGRWLKQAPYTPRCGVVARIPQASRLAQLSLAEQYAAVELFRGTMVRHSVIAYRDDSPGGVQPISFAGDAWLGYVPLRMPDTICVQERLPHGAAAVLINPTHTYRDLLMPIDSTEKGLFDAIDGNRSIGGIVERPVPSSPARPQLDQARTFFEKLWHYDQVVFDASRCPPRREEA